MVQLIILSAPRSRSLRIWEDRAENARLFRPTEIDSRHARARAKPSRFSHGENDGRAPGCDRLIERRAAHRCMTFSSPERRGDAVAALVTAYSHRANYSLSPFTPSSPSASPPAPRARNNHNYRAISVPRYYVVRTDDDSASRSSVDRERSEFDDDDETFSSVAPSAGRFARRPIFQPNRVCSLKDAACPLFSHRAMSTSV